MKTKIWEDGAGVQLPEAVLKEVTLRIDTSCVRYCLVSADTQYLLKVDDGGSCCVLDVGCTLSIAAYILELYVNGRVEPNMAQDIWEDLYAQGIFEEKTALSLNLQ